MIKFVVNGRPAPMGSKTAFVVGKRAIVTDDNAKKRRLWANAVTADAALAMGDKPLMTGPVRVSITFFFQRPQGHFGTGRNAGQLKMSSPIYHSQTPDLDKLVRCALDAMTGVVWADDKQVCCLSANREWADKCGAVVRVSENTDTRENP